jgi:hypothetical protein
MAVADLPQAHAAQILLSAGSAQGQGPFDGGTCVELRRPWLASSSLDGAEGSVRVHSSSIIGFVNRRKLATLWRDF